MLHSLTIQNIVLIEKLTLAFDKGLCVLTGETGAGKSILLDALGFVLGARGQRQLLRHGESQGSVSAEFIMPQNVKGLLEEQAIEEEETLRIRRVLMKDGKSKAFVNDVSVGVQILKAIGEALVEIHGQHDQQGLVQPESHLAIVDEYGQHEITKISNAYRAWKTLEKEKASIEQNKLQLQQEEEYLRHIYQELQTLDPQEGEEAELAEQRAVLMQKEKIVDVYAQSIKALTGDNDVVGNIGSAERIIMRGNVGEDKETEATLEQLDQAAQLLNEAIATLEQRLYDLQHDERNIDEIEERLFALREAGRKFKRTVDELPAYAQEVSDKIALLENVEAKADGLDKAIKDAKAHYQTLALNLSEKRQQAARKIETLVLEELAPLKMENASFTIAIEQQEETRWTATGLDQVQFLVSMNPGTPVAPIHKVASGGELSRFMLALKVVLSHVRSVPTLIFDEIDTGVGGSVADAIGGRLKKVSQHAQVFVVTHQPQVASYGSQHLKISKSQSQESTVTQVAELSTEDRQEEIARMLAGSDITEEARAAAKRLIEA